MKSIWINKADSFAQAEEFEQSYYSRMTGSERLEISEENFLKERVIIQLGYEPVRIDLLTSIPGCAFKEIWEHKEIGEYGDEKVFFIGKEQLIKSKKASARKQDDADIELLEQ
jgi:hypothetical protein